MMFWKFVILTEIIKVEWVGEIEVLINYYLKKKFENKILPKRLFASFAGKR